MGDDFEIKIIALRELLLLKISELEKLYNEKFIAIEKAKTLQALEYSRRLEILNGEAERLREMQATYLPREIFESKILEIEKKIVELDKYRANMEGRASQTSVIIAYGIGLVSLAFTLMNLLK